ncbi:H1FOO (predicted) [Pycnogonum litorale]
MYFLILSCLEAAKDTENSGNPKEKIKKPKARMQSRIKKVVNETKNEKQKKNRKQELVLKLTNQKFFDSETESSTDDDSRGPEITAKQSKKVKQTKAEIESSTDDSLGVEISVKPSRKVKQTKSKAEIVSTKIAFSNSQDVLEAKKNAPGTSKVQTVGSPKEANKNRTPTKPKQSTLELVTMAIKTNGDRKGTTVPFIKKYVRDHHGDEISEERLKLMIKKNLDKGLQSGVLVRPKQSAEFQGATGRFLLSKKVSNRTVQDVVKSKGNPKERIKRRLSLTKSNKKPRRQKS